MNPDPDVPPTWEEDHLGFIWYYMLQYKFLIFIAGFTLYNRYKSKQPFAEYENSRVKSVSNLDEFKKIKNSNDFVVVDFYAIWCPPCRKASVPYGKLSETYGCLMEDILMESDHSLSKEGQRWAFLKVDVTEARDIAFWADITSMPTFKMYVQGKEVAKVQGFNLPEVVNVIEAHCPNLQVKNGEYMPKGASSPIKGLDNEMDSEEFPESEETVTDSENGKTEDEEDEKTQTEDDDPAAQAADIVEANQIRERIKNTELKA